MSASRLSFTFEKCLGQGGYGEVYLARLQRPGGLNKRVAVKVLKEELRNAHEAVQRLRDEGRMLAILQHPCIVRVLEMTLIQGRVSLVTEYIDGIDLALCCKPPRLLPHRVVIGALGEVASALHCAWTTPSPETGKPLKLIHRDVKPENIRIGKHGEVKLLDFGIARTTEMFRHAKTAQGDLPFTPGYAAPEAFTKGFQGSSSDVYALGVSMYRLLAGERFYENMDLSEQVSTCCLNERYTPFLRKRLADVEGIEPAVRDLLREMLAYEAVDRPSAADVEQRCNALAEQLPGPTHVRWARGVDFPEPKGLTGGTLTGLTIEEDVIQGPRRPRGQRGVRLEPKPDASARLLAQAADDDIPPPPRVAPPSVVADLTPPLSAPDLHPPSPNRTPTPPPLPTALIGNAIRPNTGPVSLREYLPVPEDPTTAKMPFSTKQTLDDFVFENAETERLSAGDIGVLEAKTFDIEPDEPLPTPASPQPMRLYDEPTSESPVPPAPPPPPPNTSSLVPAMGREARPSTPPQQAPLTTAIPEPASAETASTETVSTELVTSKPASATPAAPPTAAGRSPLLLAAAALLVLGGLGLVAVVGVVGLAVGWMVVMG